MGFHISKIDSDELGIYIGSATVHNIANAGAFDSPVSNENELLLNNNEKIMAIVERSGIKRCLQVLKANPIAGRDVQLLASEIESKYRDGFKITY
jgi:hypothetical protein